MPFSFHTLFFVAQAMHIASVDATLGRHGNLRESQRDAPSIDPADNTTSRALYHVRR